MKRYGHLWEHVIHIDNLWVAYQNARRGKSRYKQIKEFDPLAEQLIPELQAMLIAGDYRTSEYKVFEMFERGKMRTIHALPFYPDRIVHHAITQVVSPIWERSLIRNTFAAIPGRGIHDAVRRVKAKILGSSKLFALKVDVKQFYPSVNHGVLKQLLARQIKDRQLLDALNEIVDSGPGLPIGNYLSQYFGNIYLSPIDHAVTAGLGYKNYFRYCDDMVILHHDKKCLHDLRRIMQELLAGLGLVMKENWQVFPIDQRGLDFVGYRFWPTHTLVRKKTILRLKRRLHTKRPTLNEALRVQHAAKSFSGWLRYADTIKLYKRVVSPALSNVNTYARRFRAHQAHRSAL
jgi:RNA-directed DNA polymerase